MGKGSSSVREVEPRGATGHAVCARKSCARGREGTTGLEGRARREALGRVHVEAIRVSVVVVGFVIMVCRVRGCAFIAVVVISGSMVVGVIVVCMMVMVSTRMRSVYERGRARIGLGL